MLCFPSVNEVWLAVLLLLLPPPCLSCMVPCYSHHDELVLLGMWVSTDPFSFSFSCDLLFVTVFYQSSRKLTLYTLYSKRPWAFSSTFFLPQFAIFPLSSSDCQCIGPSLKTSSFIRFIVLPSTNAWMICDPALEMMCPFQGNVRKLALGIQPLIVSCLYFLNVYHSIYLINITLKWSCLYVNFLSLSIKIEEQEWSMSWPSMFPSCVKIFWCMENIRINIFEILGIIFYLS